MWRDVEEILGISKKYIAVIVVNMVEINIAVPNGYVHYGVNCQKHTIDVITTENLEI